MFLKGEPVEEGAAISFFVSWDELVSWVGSWSEGLFVSFWLCQGGGAVCAGETFLSMIFCITFLFRVWTSDGTLGRGPSSECLQLGVSYELIFIHYKGLTGGIGGHSVWALWSGCEWGGVGWVVG